MPDPDGKLTAVQHQIMQVVWKRGEDGATACEIWREICADREVGRTTVLKQIQRLENRHWLRRKGNTRVACYTATVDVLQEPPTTERQAAPVRMTFMEEYEDLGREFPATVPDAPIELAQSPPTEPIFDVDQVATPEEIAPAVIAPWWLSIARGFALVWALGTTISVLWLVRCFVRLAAFCRGLQEHPDDGMRQAVLQAAEQVGLIRAPRLLVSARAAMPVTLGLFRPAIVLPEGFADDLPPDQCRAVLVHEMAHTARRDPWIGLAQRLAAAFYWWCPLVHRINRRLDDSRRGRGQSDQAKDHPSATGRHVAGVDRMSAGGYSKTPHGHARHPHPARS